MASPQKKDRIRMLEQRLKAWIKEKETNRCGMREYAERTINLIKAELENLRNEKE